MHTKRSKNMKKHQLKTALQKKGLATAASEAKFTSGFFYGGVAGKLTTSKTKNFRTNFCKGYMKFCKCSNTVSLSTFF